MFVLFSTCSWPLLSHTRISWFVFWVFRGGCEKALASVRTERLGWNILWQGFLLHYNNRKRGPLAKTCCATGGVTVKTKKWPEIEEGATAKGVGRGRGERRYQETPEKCPGNKDLGTYFLVFTTRLNILKHDHYWQIFVWLVLANQMAQKPMDYLFSTTVKIDNLKCCFLGICGIFLFVCFGGVCKEK